MKFTTRLLAALAATVSICPAFGQAFAQIPLREDTNSQIVMVGPFVDTTDGKTAETGLTIANSDVKLSKVGGTIANKNSGGCTHDAGGMYACTFNATDTSTVGHLQYVINVADALPVFGSFMVVEEAVYDACCAASAAPLTAAAVWAESARTLTAIDEDSTTLDLNATAIVVGSITDGAIAAADFAAGAIDASAIATDAIGAAEIAANALTTAEIATGAISSDEIADDAIDAGAIATDAIGAAEIAASAIAASEIATDAIGAAELAADAIGAAEIANDALDAAATAADFRTEIQDADVESINGVTITGDGSATPFGVP